MPKKNEHAFSADGVLAYMQESDGVKFQSAQLGKVFRVKSESMRDALNQLLEKKSIKETVIGRHRFYFIPDPNAIAAKPAVAWETKFRVLKLPDGIRDRCAELYPNGANFISLKGAE